MDGLLGEVMQTALILNHGESERRCRTILYDLMLSTIKLALRSELVHLVLLELLAEQAIIVYVSELLEANFLIPFIFQSVDNCSQSHVLLLILLRQQTAHLTLRLPCIV